MEKLTQLQIGHSGKIIEFTDHELAPKLIEMGCLPGEIVVLDQIAPLGCPLVLKIYDCKISIRKSEAETILITRNF